MKRKGRMKKREKKRKRKKREEFEECGEPKRRWTKEGNPILTRNVTSDLY